MNNFYYDKEILNKIIDVGNNKKGIKLFLKNNDIINIKDDMGNTLLMYTCICYSIKYKLYLIQKLINKYRELLDIPNMAGWTALMLSIRHIVSTERGEQYRSMMIQVVKLLLENGANPNLKNMYGCTALGIATEFNYDGRYKLIELLIEYGADVNIKNNYGRAVIFYILNDDKSMNVILKNGANVNIRDIYGISPLMVAISRYNNVNTVLKIINYCTDYRYIKNLPIKKILEMDNENIRKILNNIYENINYKLYMDKLFKDFKKNIIA